MGYTRIQRLLPARKKKQRGSSTEIRVKRQVEKKTRGKIKGLKKFLAPNEVWGKRRESKTCFR